MQIEVITGKILVIRGRKVMLDHDLAGLYGVETRILNQAVKRNSDRFPEDFMFQLSEKEAANLRSQNVISSYGGRRYIPYAFTEHGVAMLSSVLKSKKAIEVNIQIIRAFIKMRQMLLDNDALKYAVEGLERRTSKNERDIQIAIKAIQGLLSPPEPEKQKKKMGFAP